MNETLERLVSGSHLSEQEADDLLVALTDESMDASVAGALLTAMRTKGETADEVRGFAKAMRRLANRPPIPEGVHGVDVVGTGGDGSGSLNLSTGAALITAACGQPVIKHGNRSISSKSGSADVLEQLGLVWPENTEAATACLEQTGFTFLFAPYFHPAMKTVAPVRRALGIRTIFNILGPLTNPAQPPYYVIGAFSNETARLMADALAGLPIERAFVVHGAPSWDEATPVGPFEFYDVRPGSVKLSRRDPQTYGVERCTPDDLIGGSPEENAQSLRATLGGEAGPHRDAITLGAGLALEVCGKVSSLGEGLEAARAAIDDGSASKLIEGLNAYSATRKEANA